jgi:hypothetical protein
MLSLCASQSLGKLAQSTVIELIIASHCMMLQKLLNTLTTW